MAADIFDRLGSAQLPQTKVVVQPRGNTTGAAIFLIDILTNGPVPVTTIEERGTARGFNRKRLLRAKQRIGIVAIKEGGKLHGRWFWSLPQHTQELFWSSRAVSMK